MGNSVQELLEMLYETIREARGFPLVAEKCVIERDKALDLLDEIRAKFPTELAEAKRLVDARTEFIMTQTYSLSKTAAARSMMFRCPSVMGSKLPGYTAIFIQRHSPLR